MRAGAWPWRQSAISPKQCSQLVCSSLQDIGEGELTKYGSPHSSPTTNGRSRPQARSYRPWHPELHLRRQERNRHPGSRWRRSNPLQCVLHRLHLPGPDEHASQGGIAIQRYRRS